MSSVPGSRSSGADGTALTGRPLRVMLVLSTDDFESFYGEAFGLDRQSFVAEYRNDWSWQYARLLLDAGLEPIIAVRSLGQPEMFRTAEGVVVQFLPVGRPGRLWRRYRRAPTSMERAGTVRVEEVVPAEPLPAGQLWRRWARQWRLARAPLKRYAAETLSVMGSLRSFRTGCADVVYVQEYWTAQFDLIALTARVPVVAGDHGGKARHQIKVLKRRAFRRAVWLTAQTRDEVEAARRYGARAELLPNPVDINFYHPDDPGVTTSRPQRMLVVARLADTQKRISDVIQALSQLPSSWTLDIVGTGPDRDSLAALADRLGVADRVHFVGFVTDPVDLRERYRACGVAVMASAQEARTLVVLEAMACGCAVVVSDIPSFRELVQDCGDVVVQFPVGDVVALAQAVELAYADRVALGNRARQAAVDNLGVEPFARRLVALLNEAARASKRSTR
jgi:glycosyltransferase involved in cell wall biosynthesis